MRNALQESNSLEQNQSENTADTVHSKFQQAAEVLNPHLQAAGQSAFKASQKAKESASHYLSPLGTLVGTAASKANAKL